MKTCEKRVLTVLTAVTVVLMVSSLAFGEEKLDLFTTGDSVKAGKAKVEAAAESTKATAEKATEAGVAKIKPLPSTMVYEMKQLNATLDKAEKYAKAKKPHEAQRVFKSVKQQWDTKKGWNKGKFDPKHPDVLTLEARFAKIGKMVEELNAKPETK